MAVVGRHLPSSLKEAFIHEAFICRTNCLTLTIPYLFATVHVVHEVLSSAAVLGPPPAVKERRAGTDASLHGVHAAVDQDGVHGGSGVGIDPVLACMATR